MESIAKGFELVEILRTSSILTTLFSDRASVAPWPPWGACPPIVETRRKIVNVVGNCQSCRRGGRFKMLSSGKMFGLSGKFSPLLLRPVGRLSLLSENVKVVDGGGWYLFKMLSGKFFGLSENFYGLSEK